MRILITAGPTREYFDSVRFISNPSSGKMGYALAEEALARGHEVVLVTGPVALLPPPGAEVHRVTSAAEMAEACRRVFASCDAACLTAAVCDYRPAERLPHKLKKQDSPRTVVLVPTEDIATSLGREKGHRVLVGFAMEDRDPHTNAEAKLRRKRCDLIVLNGPENVGSDQAAVQIFSAEAGWSDPIRGTKREVARAILDRVEVLVARRRHAARG